MKAQRLSWMIFLVCTALVLLSLAWMTSSMLRMERSELEAREFANHQEMVRLALWRMDSWMAPRVAREAARPYTDYQPLTPQYNAYSKMLEPLEAGEILTASPLLPFQSDYFRLHFQIDQSGVVTSPQAPTAAQLERLPPELIPTTQWIANEREVEKLSNMVEVDTLVGCVAAVEESMEKTVAAPNEIAIVLQDEAQQDAEMQTRTASREADLQGAPAPNMPAQTDAARPRQTMSEPAQQASRSVQEWTKRRDNFAQNIQDAGQSMQQQSLVNDSSPDTSLVVGPLVPIWLGVGHQQSELMFVRRVRVNGEEVYQGFVCDWPKLRSALLTEIEDLFPTATLVANRGLAMDSESSIERPIMSLATLPVSLQAPVPECEAASGVTPGRITAAIAWIVVLAGVGLTGSTLRSSIAFGRKRAQFASAVTHELRTPLTTFKMYTDMLAEDMVSSEEQKREYLRTLQGESDRLARLVENVLSYARVEDGRTTPNSRAMTVSALLGRVLPQLERRAHASGMSITMEGDADRNAAIHTDDDAVGQILLNLVDNACKYGCKADGSAIHLKIDMQNGSLILTVRDDGPGVTASDARHLFQAFRRGSTSEASQPGLGIGLTLSRALARKLGGELRYVSNTPCGASFELTVPLGVSTS